jgi:hypothetical protein
LYIDRVVRLQKGARENTTTTPRPWPRSATCENSEDSLAYTIVHGRRSQNFIPGRINGTIDRGSTACSRATFSTVCSATAIRL